MAKRIICVMGRVLDQDDGLGVYAYNLLDHLARQDRDSHYVIILNTSKNKSIFSDYTNVETRVIPAQIKMWWDQITCLRAARQVRADIIFNPKFSLPLFSLRPGVFVLHGSDWYVNPQNYEWWDNLYIRIMMPLYCWKAAGLVAISGCIKNDLVKYAGIDGNKVSVTYAAPSSHFKIINDKQALLRFKERYDLPDKFILSVARAYHTGHGHLPPYPGGNVEGLVKGYQHYRANSGNLPLVIAGHDIDRYLAENGYSDINLEGIKFIGFVPHEEIAYLYNLAYFFVLTTLYESFAFPLVESMACGCPVIAPSTGACPEVAGRAARLVSPLKHQEIGEAMEELSSSEELREHLKLAGLRRVGDFNWNHTATETLKVFNKIAPIKLFNQASLKSTDG